MPDKIITLGNLKEFKDKLANVAVSGAYDDLVGKPDTATELEIKRLFRTEYPIVISVTNGSVVEGSDTTIWTDETAAVAFTANDGYYLPDSVSVQGAEFVYEIEGNTGMIGLRNATGDVTITVVCEGEQPQPGGLTEFAQGMNISGVEVDPTQVPTGGWDAYFEALNTAYPEGGEPSLIYVASEDPKEEHSIFAAMGSPEMGWGIICVQEIGESTELCYLPSASYAAAMGIQDLPDGPGWYVVDFSGGEFELVVTKVTTKSSYSFVDGALEVGTIETLFGPFNGVVIGAIEGQPATKLKYYVGLDTKGFTVDPTINPTGYDSMDEFIEHFVDQHYEYDSLFDYVGDDGDRARCQISYGSDEPFGSQYMFWITCRNGGIYYFTKGFTYEGTTYDKGWCLLDYEHQRIIPITEPTTVQVDNLPKLTMVVKEIHPDFAALNGTVICPIENTGIEMSNITDGAPIRAFVVDTGANTTNLDAMLASASGDMTVIAHYSDSAIMIMTADGEHYMLGINSYYDGSESAVLMYSSVDFDFVVEGQTIHAPAGWSAANMEEMRYDPIYGDVQIVMMLDDNSIITVDNQELLNNINGINVGMIPGEQPQPTGLTEISVGDVDNKILFGNTLSTEQIQQTVAASVASAGGLVTSVLEGTANGDTVNLVIAGNFDEIGQEWIACVDNSWIIWSAQEITVEEHTFTEGWQASWSNQYGFSWDRDTLTMTFPVNATITSVDSAYNGSIYGKASA